jgi:hypothetical protein
MILRNVGLRNLNTHTVATIVIGIEKPVMFT